MESFSTNAGYRDAIKRQNTVTLTKQESARTRSWWTEQRIRSVVDVDYVRSKFDIPGRTRLSQLLSFGAGLTDDRYLDFIVERAPIFFLILAQLGIIHHIFSIIDRSYDDGDLPLALETITDLRLGGKANDRMSQKFYACQYEYLLRELRHHQHISYDPDEIVPLDLTAGPVPGTSLTNWSRIILPRRDVTLALARCRLPTTESQCRDSMQKAGLLATQEDSHAHIATLWGSYSYRGNQYGLSTFLAQRTLDDFIRLRGSDDFLSMEKSKGRRLLLQWLHCLSDALVHMHANDLVHSPIRSTNIMIDNRLNIAFGEVGALTSSASEHGNNEEMEDSRPCEAQSPLQEKGNQSNPFQSYLSKSSLFRHRSISSKSSSDDSSNPSRGLAALSSANGQGNSSLLDLDKMMDNAMPLKPQRPQQTGWHNGLSPDWSKATVHDNDIYCLGWVFLDILSFMHKFKHGEMAKYMRPKRRGFSASHQPNHFCVDPRMPSNLPRLRKWMKKLDDRAFDLDDQAYRATPPLLSLISAMLSEDAERRPYAEAVRDELHTILVDFAGFNARDQSFHCGLEDEQGSEPLSAMSPTSTRHASWRTSSLKSPVSFSSPVSPLDAEFKMPFPPASPASQDQVALGPLEAYRGNSYVQAKSGLRVVPPSRPPGSTFISPVSAKWSDDGVMHRNFSRLRS